MASADSVLPVALAEACVTCPTSFVPLGRTVLPSDFTLSAVRAVTASPGLLFFESTGELSVALKTVPDESPALVWLDCADADEEADALPVA